MATASELKERGNQFFRNKEYEKAEEYYTQALQLSSTSPESVAGDRLIYFKNRAACRLKLKRFPEATEDCLSALKIDPADPKSLYRYAQALEGAGKEAESLVQLKKLLSVDSKNKEANEMARRLMTSLKQNMERFQKTENIAEEMFKRLSDPSANPRPSDEQIQAAKNIAILSREEGGADQILRLGGVARLLPYLQGEGPPELVSHVLQVFVGLVTNNTKRSKAVFAELTLDTVSAHISSAHVNIGMGAVNILKEMVLSLTLESETDNATVISSIIVPIIQVTFLSFESFQVAADVRDGIMEFFVKTIPRPGMAALYAERELVKRVLQVSASTWKETSREEEDEEMWEGLPVSADCRMNASMVLSTLHSNIQGKDDKRLRDLFKEQCQTYFTTQMQRENVESKLELLTSLSCLLQGVPKIGNEIFADDAILDLSIAMSESPDMTCQVVAAEAIVLAASDSSRCQGIMGKGLPALKNLYHSPDARIQVRALVGLCKLGMHGGSFAGSRPFVEGSSLKLEKACRKFLVGGKKVGGANLHKWAAEGIAFLSLDADVKETLVRDQSALKAIFQLVKLPDKSLLYGIASTLVNLTNSYDKPDRNPDLEELGKFAGENVPKEQEKDGESYVKERVELLLKEGVVQVLAELSTSPSSATREQLSRVFLALVSEVSNRGVVIQQGGVKCLIQLALENTEQGKMIASQSLAKIGITNNPQLAFPGQRTLEVVRPLVQLLRHQCTGLQQFEGLMALTNLASMSDEVRRRIFREGAVPAVEGLMFEEDELIRRAATEMLCNMIQLEEVERRFHGDDLERIKLWTLFSGEDDEALVRAASGGLAQLSHDPVICRKILEVKSAKEILKELVAKDNQELIHRGLYILANLMEAGPEIAEEIIKDEFLEVFMAYLQGEYPANIKGEAERALKKAVEYGLIMSNPDIS